MNAKGHGPARAALKFPPPISPRSASATTVNFPTTWSPTSCAWPRRRRARFLRHAHLGRHFPVHGQLQPGRRSETNQESLRLPGFPAGKIKSAQSSSSHCLCEDAGYVAPVLRRASARFQSARPPQRTGILPSHRDAATPPVRFGDRWQNPQTEVCATLAPAFRRALQIFRVPAESSRPASVYVLINNTAEVSIYIKISSCTPAPFCYYPSNFKLVVGGFVRSEGRARSHWLVLACSFAGAAACARLRPHPDRSGRLRPRQPSR